MAVKTTRKIVKIDEDKCNGCGLCVPSCAEGAIRIVDGKARLVADNLCDGLGNCLGECPMDAITIEEREADGFDHDAVAQHLAAEGESGKKKSAAAPHADAHHAGGCPGAAVRMLNEDAPAKPSGGCPGAALRMLLGEQEDTPEPASTDAADRPSRLRQWPTQLSLVPPTGAIWQDADVLIAADCVPTAMADFHEKLLAGRTLAIACPKLDDTGPYVEKLTRVFAENSVRSVTVAHMEAPCCTGIVGVVAEAIRRSGRDDIDVRDVTVGIDGRIREDG